MLQKFQEDEQFRKFVLTQFVKQQAQENGLKAAKEPHPHTIEESEKESYRVLSDLHESQNSKCKEKDIASPSFSDSDHADKSGRKLNQMKQHSQFKKEAQYPAVMQAFPAQEEESKLQSNIIKARAAIQKGKQD
jgi:hypothetical protein